MTAHCPSGSAIGRCNSRQPAGRPMCPMPYTFHFPLILSVGGGRRVGQMYTDVRALIVGDVGRRLRLGLALRGLYVSYDYVVLSSYRNTLCELAVAVGYKLPFRLLVR